MGKILVLVLLVVIAIWLIRRALRGKASPPRPPLQGDLIACARCAMHLPRAEAREAGGRLYCGEEHARLGPEG